MINLLIALGLASSPVVKSHECIEEYLYACIENIDSHFDVETSEQQLTAVYSCIAETFKESDCI